MDKMSYKRRIKRDTDVITLDDDNDEIIEYLPDLKPKTEPKRQKSYDSGISMASINNRCVPDIIILDDENFPSSSGINKSNNSSPLKTPSPDRRKLLYKSLSSTPEVSPAKKFEAIASQFVKSLNSPKFLSKIKKNRNIDDDDVKIIEKKPKAKRLHLIAPTDDSKQCQLKIGRVNTDFKPDIKPIMKSENQLLDTTNREKTPEYYWETDMPDYEEQKKRGYVIESDSPLKAKKSLK